MLIIVIIALKENSIGNMFKYSRKQFWKVRYELMCQPLDYVKLQDFNPTQFLFRHFNGASHAYKLINADCRNVSMTMVAS